MSTAAWFKHRFWLSNRSVQQSGYARDATPSSSLSCLKHCLFYWIRRFTGQHNAFSVALLPKCPLCCIALKRFVYFIWHWILICVLCVAGLAIAIVIADVCYSIILLQISIKPIELGHGSRKYTIQHFCCFLFFVTLARIEAFLSVNQCTLSI